MNTRENGGGSRFFPRNLMQAGSGDRVAFSARRFCDVSLFGSLYVPACILINFNHAPSVLFQRALNAQWRRAGSGSERGCLSAARPWNDPSNATDRLAPAGDDRSVTGQARKTYACTGCGLPGGHQRRRPGSSRKKGEGKRIGREGGRGGPEWLAHFSSLFIGIWVEPHNGPSLPQPRILHGTYSPSYSTLRRCQEAICVAFLRVRIVQDWRIRVVRAFAGEGLSPLRQGEIAVVTLLHGNGALADL